MSTLTPNENETKNAARPSVPKAEQTKFETLSKTPAAAKMSGTFHETAGFIKRKLGELSSDSALEDAGRNQQLLGKVHRLVGSLRGARNAVQASLPVQGGKLIDGTAKMLDALKKRFLK